MANLNLTVKVLTQGADKLGGISGKLAGAAKGALVVGGALAGVGVAAGAAFAGMAIDAEKAQAKLDNTFKSMGASSFTTIEALDKQATALAAATTFDDDSIKDAQATLLTFGNVTGKVFDRTLAASTDLAAFFETDVTTASLTLGKALNDPVKGLTKLTRQGITFTEEQEAQVRAMTEAGDVAGAQAIILSELEKQVGGTAGALADTTGGQLTQAMNALGEVGESLGVILLPLFTALAQGLKGFADFVVANMPIIQSVIGGVVSTISGFFSQASGAASGLGAVFAILVDWVRANLPTIQSVAGQVFGAIANVVKVVGPIILELAKVILPILGAAAGILFKALDIAFKGIGGAFEVLGNVFETVSGAIEGVVSGVVGAFKAIYNAFAGFWNSIDISFPRIDVPFFGTIGGFSIGLPDIPMLAKGGIVTQPTLAILGERGPEAVVPLGSQTPGMVNNFAFSVTTPIPDESGLVELVERSQRLSGALAWD